MFWGGLGLPSFASGIGGGRSLGGASRARIWPSCAAFAGGRSVVRGTAPPRVFPYFPPPSARIAVLPRSYRRELAGTARFRRTRIDFEILNDCSRERSRARADGPAAWRRTVQRGRRGERRPVRGLYGLRPTLSRPAAPWRAMPSSPRRAGPPGTSQGEQQSPLAPRLLAQRARRVPGGTTRRYAPTRAATSRRQRTSRATQTSRRKRSSYCAGVCTPRPL